MEREYWLCGLFADGEKVVMRVPFDRNGIELLTEGLVCGEDCRYVMLRAATYEAAVEASKGVVRI